MANNLTTEITIDGTVYTVDLAKAQQAGLIKKKTIKRRVRVGDVPIGSVFKWQNNSEGNTSRFVVVSPNSAGYIACTYIDHDKVFQYSFGRFGIQFYKDSDIEGFYDQTGQFISEIEEN